MIVYLAEGRLASSGGAKRWWHDRRPISHASTTGDTPALDLRMTKAAAGIRDRPRRNHMGQPTAAAAVLLGMCSRNRTKFTNFTVTFDFSLG